MNLTFSIYKSKFGVDEIVVVENLYKRYSRKSNLKKIDVIAKMKVYSSIIEIRRFLRACILSNLDSSLSSYS